MGFIDEIKAKAKTCKKTIVLPETEDIRTYEAAEAVLKEGTANLILIGSEEEIAKNKGSFDISGATIVAVSYTHLDVYKRQVVQRSHPERLQVLSMLLLLIIRMRFRG